MNKLNAPPGGPQSAYIGPIFARISEKCRNPCAQTLSLPQAPPGVDPVAQKNQEKVC